MCFFTHWVTGKHSAAYPIPSPSLWFLVSFINTTKTIIITTTTWTGSNFESNGCQVLLHCSPTSPGSRVTVSCSISVWRELIMIMIDHCHMSLSLTNLENWSLPYNNSSLTNLDKVANDQVRSGWYSQGPGGGDFEDDDNNLFSIMMIPFDADII